MPNGGGGQGISAGAVAVAAVGGLLIYSSLTNRSLLQATRDIMTGKTPAKLSSTSGNSPQTPISQALAQPGSTTGKLQFTGTIDAIYTAARQYLGVKYAWAKANPGEGFDCSGLVNWVIGHDLGWPIPGYPFGHAKFDGTSHGPVVGQWYLTPMCTTIGKADAVPGDLVIYGTTHMGIYAGNGQMLDAPDFGQVVKVENVWSPPTPVYRRYTQTLTQWTTGAGPVSGKLS